MSTEKLVRIKQRVDTKENWERINPVLLEDEIGFDSDSKNYKIGNGISPWTELNYASIGINQNSNNGEIFNDIFNKAEGSYSHAEGRATSATADFQHVQGRYNETNNNAAFIIGNGTSESERSNAVTVDWDGNIKVATQTTFQSSANTLTTKSYVDSKESYKVGDMITTYQKDLDDSWELCCGQVLTEDEYPAIKHIYNYPFNNGNFEGCPTVFQSTQYGLNFAVGGQYIYILSKSNSSSNDRDMIAINTVSKQIFYYPKAYTNLSGINMTSINNIAYVYTSGTVYKIVEPIDSVTPPSLEEVAILPHKYSFSCIIGTNNYIIIQLSSSGNANDFMIGNKTTPLESIIASSSIISTNLSSSTWSYMGYIPLTDSLVFYQQSGYYRWYYITADKFVTTISETPTTLTKALTNVNYYSQEPFSTVLNTYPDRLIVKNGLELYFSSTGQGFMTKLSSRANFYSPKHKQHLYCGSNILRLSETGVVIDQGYYENIYRDFKYLTDDWYMALNNDQTYFFVAHIGTQLPNDVNTYIKIK